MNFKEVYLGRNINSRLNDVVGEVTSDGDRYRLDISQLHEAFENGLGLPIDRNVFTAISRFGSFELYNDGAISVTFRQTFRDTRARYFGSSELVGSVQRRYLAREQSGPDIIARIERGKFTSRERRLDALERQCVLTNNFLGAFRALLPKQGPTHTPS